MAAHEPQPMDPQLNGLALRQVTELLSRKGIYLDPPTTSLQATLKQIDFSDFSPHPPATQQHNSYPDSHTLRRAMGFSDEAEDYPELPDSSPLHLMPPGLIMLTRVVQDIRGPFEILEKTSEEGVVLRVIAPKSHALNPTYFVANPDYPIIDVTDFLLEKAVPDNEHDPERKIERAVSLIKTSIWEIANRSMTRKADYGRQYHIIDSDEKNSIIDYVREIAHALKTIYSENDPRYVNVNPHEIIDYYLMREEDLVEHARSS